MFRSIILFGLMTFLISCSNYQKPETEQASLKEDVVLSRSDNQYIVDTKLKEYDIIDQDGTSVLSDGKLTVTPSDDYKIFKAINGKDTLFIGERNLNVKGVPNLRDVGGLETEEGYQMKWGKLFRSGKISKIDPSENKRLENIGLKTIIDFRSSEEKNEDPDGWPEMDRIQTVAIPMGSSKDSTKRSNWLEDLKKEDFDADQFMYNANKRFVIEQSPELKRYFEVLLDQENYPLLYHCSAGKDRTGLATFLLLSALGVDKETVIDEYLLSNYYLQERSEDDIKKAALIYGIDSEKLRKLMKVKPEFIQGALDAIEEHYGTVDKYLCQELGVCHREKEKLKQILLYNYKSEFETKIDSLGVELPSNTAEYQVNYELEGAKNFRSYNISPDDDIKLKPNRIYRSEALHKISDKDVKKLEDMGILTIIDFRYDEEIQEDPDRKPSTVKNYKNPEITRSKHSLNKKIDSVTYRTVRNAFLEGEYQKVDRILDSLNIDVNQSRHERYVEFAIDYTDSYSQFMKTLADESNYPIVYHCQGGKDRAGFASAILLKTLGYDDQTIIDDFLTTNLHNYESIEEYYSSGVESFKGTIGAHSNHLMAAFEAIDDKYGSFENYLHDGLQLSEAELESIRNNLLEE